MTAWPLSILLSVFFLAISSFAAMTSVLALYLSATFQMDAKDVGLLFTLSGGTTVVVRGLLLGQLIKRYGEAATSRIGLVALMTALIAVPLLPSGSLAVLISPLYAFGAGTLFPALASLVSRATDEDWQGAVLGGSQLVGGLGRVIGPLWAGFIFQSLGHGTPFLVGAVLVFLALLVAFRIPAPRPRKPRTTEPAAEAESGIPAD